LFSGFHAFDREHGTQHLAKTAWEKNVGGFVRDVTGMLWDAVGQRNNMRVKIEECESLR
jgi:hypothetical protein